MKREWLTNWIAAIRDTPMPKEPIFLASPFLPESKNAGRREQAYEPDINDFRPYRVFVEFEMDGLRECVVDLRARNRSDALSAAIAMFPTRVRVKVKSLWN